MMLALGTCTARVARSHRCESRCLPCTLFYPSAPLFYVILFYAIIFQYLLCTFIHNSIHSVTSSIFLSMSKSSCRRIYMDDAWLTATLHATGAELDALCTPNLASVSSCRCMDKAWFTATMHATPMLSVNTPCHGKRDATCMVCREADQC